MDGQQQHSVHRALVVGIEGAADADDLDRTGTPPRAHLPYAPDYATRIQNALRAFGYRTPDHPHDPASTAPALQSAVERVLASGPGYVVVHLLTHGELGRSGALYAVGGDGERTGTGVEQWLRSVEDAEPADSAPYVLFLLDLCFAGGTARLPWQHALRAEERRTWVMSANEIDEPAWEGWLSRAVAEVLESFVNGRLRVDPSVSHVPLDFFSREVRQRVAAYVAEGAGQVQRVLPPAPESGADLPHFAFFPNPRYGTGTVEGPRAELDRVAAPLFDEVADVRHFTGRASGTEGVFGDDRKGLFRGRDAEVQALSAWLRGEGGDLCVLTGKAGVGKSALLGMLVCAAHPLLRAKAHWLWQSLSEPPPVVDRLAVVHARQRSVADVMGALGRQWELGRVSTAEEVVSALDGQRAVLVLDALDEAEHPRELAAALLTLAPVCRMLVGVRPELRFRALFRRAGRAGRVDLNKVSRRRLHGELRAYVRDVLRVSPRYSAAGLEATVDELADGIARTLTRRKNKQYGEFLVAALYLRHLVLRAAPVDPGEVHRLSTAVPRDLGQLLHLDLGLDLDGDEGPQETPWLREVLSALAYARGAGMPEEVVRATAPAFRKDGGDPDTDGGPDIGGDTGGGPDIEEVRTVMEAARFYLRRDVDAEGRTVYRLFHQGLADRLRAAAGPTRTDAVLTRLLALAGTPRHWHTAEPYVLRHAARHAAEADRLAELLGDTQFLVHSPPEHLMPLLAPLGWAALRLHEVPPSAELYAKHVDSLRDLDPSQRHLFLAVAAAAKGKSKVVEALSPGCPWRVRQIGSMPLSQAHVQMPDNEWATVDRRSPIHTTMTTDVDGRPHLLVGSAGGHVHLWDLVEGRESAGYSGGGNAEHASDASFASLDGNPFAVTVHTYSLPGAPSSQLRLWQLPKMQTVRHERFGDRLDLGSVTCTTVDGREVAVLCGSREPRWRTPDGVLLMWDLREHRAFGEPLVYESAPLGCVAAASDGTAHVVTGAHDGTVGLWDLSARTRVRTFTGHEGPVVAATTVAVDGRPHAVTGGADGTVRVWDLATGAAVHTLAGHGQTVWCVASAALGDRPHAVTGGADRTVRVWDLATGAVRETLRLPSVPRSLAVASDGSLLVALKDTVVALKPGPHLPPLAPGPHLPPLTPCP
ncbi:hypothetical protein ACH4E8_17050 [Streptomyces sp. NPDC017979]|uniref:hypothetical protein n=1 Tax=Streptomyces sp. NPDC017979 TaxID=3365024 RepID=UPI003798582B